MESAHACAGRSSVEEGLLMDRGIAFIVIGANGSMRGEKVTSLARWPPNPSRCWALTMEGYQAVGPLSTSGGVFPIARLTTDA